ncbi:expressed protein [Echinococcus multilocularis]|uniref:Expressed protein n=1 Tax=Echinococcus multilocularis TaxID=6211 RepID=A0A087VWG7_ECHMU|nr:expressed protein [Echinococcus multilocularis]
MYAAGASPLQVLSSPAMFSPPDGCLAGLPSPGRCAHATPSTLSTLEFFVVKAVIILFDTLK